MTKVEYKTILEAAVTELAELLGQREALDTERDKLDYRIRELKQGIIALGPLAGLNSQAKYAELFPEFNLFLPVGLKEGVLAVLSSVKTDGFMTPVAIRDGLAATGYENKSKNILPSIHNVLKRLESANPPEVESTDLEGKTGYRLIRERAPKQNAFQIRLGKAVQDAIHPPSAETKSFGIERPKKRDAFQDLISEVKKTKQ